MRKKYYLNVAVLIYIYCTLPNVDAMTAANAIDIRPRDYTTPLEAARNSSVEKHDYKVICRLNLAQIASDDKLRFLGPDKILKKSQCTHVVYKSYYVNLEYNISRLENKHFDLLQKFHDFVLSSTNLESLLEISLDHTTIEVEGVKGTLSERNRFKSPAHRRSFIENMKIMLSQHNIGGLFLDSTFYTDVSDASDFIILAKELVNENITVATEIELGTKSILETYGDLISTVSRLFDFIFVKGFYFQSGKNVVVHNAPVYPSEEHQKESIFEHLKYLIYEKRVHASSLILAIPFFGWHYEITDAKSLFDPFGAVQSKSWRFKTICRKLFSWENFTLFVDNTAQAHIFKGTRNLFSVEDPVTVVEKVVLVHKFGLQGVMAWDVDMEDIQQECYKNFSFPLLRTINYALEQNVTFLSNPSTSLSSQLQFLPLSECPEIQSSSSTKFKPIVLAKGYIFYAKEGERLEIQCTAELYSTTKNITFLRHKANKTETLNGAENLRLSINDCNYPGRPNTKVVSTLYIDNVNASTTGKYSCSAEKTTDIFFVQLKKWPYAVKNNNIWIERTPIDFSVPKGAEKLTPIDHQKYLFCKWDVPPTGVPIPTNFDLLQNQNGTYTSRALKLCTHFVHGVFLINDKYALVDSDQMKYLNNIKSVKRKSGYPNSKHLLYISMEKRKGVSLDSELYLTNFLNITNILKSLKMDGVYLSSSFYNSNRKIFTPLLKVIKPRFNTANLIVVTEIYSSQKNNPIEDNVILEMIKYSDFMVILGFGFLSQQYKAVYNAPLQSSEKEDENISDNLDFLITLGSKTNKLILGVPITGKLYELGQPEAYPFGVNSVIRSSQNVSYTKVCPTNNQENGWEMYFDNNAKVPFFKNGDQWVTIDTPKSIKEKVEVAITFGLRGIMASSFDQDDIGGKCLGFPFPMLRTINFALRRNVSIDENEHCSDKQTVHRPLVSIEDEDKLISVKFGETKEILCEGEGNPPPEILWYRHIKNKQILLSNGSIYSIEQRNNTNDHECSAKQSILEIRMTPEIAGKYSCLARNSEGSSTTIFFLSQEDRPLLHSGSNLWVEEIPSELKGSTQPNNNTVMDPDKVIICGLNISKLHTVHQDTGNESRNANESIRPYSFSDVEVLFDSKLCTHIVYNSFSVSHKGYTIQPSYKTEQIERLTNYSASHENLKKLIRVSTPSGNERDRKRFLNNLVNTNKDRKIFIKNMKEFVKKYRLSGLHLDSSWYIFAPVDDSGIVALSEEICKEFHDDGLLVFLEIELKSKIVTTENYATFAEISPLYDLVIVKGYNFRTGSSTMTGHNAPIHSKNKVEENIYENLKDLRCRYDVTFNKLVLGVPFFGWSHTLSDGNSTDYGFNGITVPNQRNSIAYYDLCSKRYSRNGSRTGEWKTYWDYIAKVPFLKNNFNGWISFENSESIAEKAMLAKNLSMKGIMIDNVDLDDFEGQCGDQPYQLTKTINNVFRIPVVVVPPKIQPSTYGWISATLIFFCLMIAAFSYSMYARRKIAGLTKSEIKQFKEGSIRAHGNEYSGSGDSENPENRPYDESYEIPPAKYFVDTGSVLGYGAFGIVFNGNVNGVPAAIKSTKPDADKQYLKSLLSELKILIYLGKHPNIVNLIGASTSDLEKGIVYIFVELCPLGSLHDYLRKSRKKFIASDAERIDTEDKDSFTTRDLVNWSYQIANGLQHLGSKKLIHGDLATRNVLLFEKDVAKLTDFGLSRKLYNYSNYVKKNQEPLPWRWMAIESLRDLTFSIQSDMWSFGVTIWEIFSLAETPYPGYSWTIDFTEQLENNLRMTKPRHSSDAIYAFMIQCWENNPEQRPTPEHTADFFAALLDDNYNYTSTD